MKKLIFVILVILSQSAIAGWTLVSTNETGEKYYVDFSTRKFNGSFVQVWVYEDWIETFRDTLSIKLHTEYDCTNATSSILYTTAYSGHNLSGKVIVDETILRKSWFKILPDSSGMKVFKTVCQR